MSRLTFDQAKVWRVGADIDTDVLAPGAYMQHGIEVIAQHCLESVRPEFAATVRPGDVLVAGANFGRQGGDCTFVQWLVLSQRLQPRLFVADLRAGVESARRRDPSF